MMYKSYIKEHRNLVQSIIHIRKGKFLLGFILMLLVTVLGYCGQFFTMRVIDAVFENRHLKDAIVMVFLFFMIQCIIRLAERLEGFTTLSWSNDVQSEMRKGIIKKLANDDLVKHSHLNFGLLDTAFSENLETLSTSILDVVHAYILFFFSIIVTIFIGFNYHFSLVILLILELYITSVLMKKATIKRTLLNQKRMDSRNDYYSALEREFNGFEASRLNFRVGHMIKNIHSKCHLFLKSSNEMVKNNEKIVFTFDLFELIFNLLTLLVFVYLVSKNLTTVGAYIAYIGVKDIIIGGVNAYLKQSFYFEDFKVARNNIEVFCDLESIYSDEPAKKELNETWVHSLNVQNVVYSYADHLNVYRYDFHFHKGNIYQIRGDNGTGKTTLVRLVAGLIKPSEGIILINENMRLEGLNDTAMQGIVHILPQKIQWYDDTLLYNLTLKESILKEEKQKLHHLVKAFDLDEVIDLENVSLHRSIFYKTPVFSGGQMKKIGLIRMLMSEAPVWFVDEPFNDLDVKARSVFKQAIERCRKEKIIVAITHENLGIDAIKTIDLN